MVETHRATSEKSPSTPSAFGAQRENPPTVTEELEVKTEITVNKSSSEATPETIVSESKVEAVTEVVPSEIDWVSYPYNSGGAAGNSFAGRYTLENRANKVKERILACATSNELPTTSTER